MRFLEASQFEIDGGQLTDTFREQLRMNMLEVSIVRQINLGDLLRIFFGSDDLHEEIVEHVHADVGVR